VAIEQIAGLHALGCAGHAAMGSVPSDEPRSPSITTYIIAGVSGSGKSTVGKQLALRLDSEFFDGDDFHTPGNKGAMLSLKLITHVFI
jgi:Shikimate kinase